MEVHGEVQRPEKGRAVSGTATVKLEPLTPRPQYARFRKDETVQAVPMNLCGSLYLHTNVSEHVYSICTCGILYVRQYTCSDCV